MFSTDEYAWKDVKLFMGGRPISGIRGVKFGVERTMTDIYASGDKPHTRTKGNKKYAGEIKLLQSEAEALIDSAKQLYGPKADPTDMTFDATVSFAREVTDRIRTHQLFSVDITKFEMGMEQDDPNMEITLPIMIGDIEWGV